MSRSTNTSRIYDTNKLRELVLYVSNLCESDPRFGMVKLNKIILRVDRLAYIRYGKTVTNVRYKRLPAGFVPDPMKQVLIGLEGNKEIAIRERMVAPGKTQKRVIALREPVLDDFSAQEIALVGEVLKQVFRFDASIMSLLSHGTAWRIAQDKEVIPEAAFLLSDDQRITEQDIQECHKLRKEQDWDSYVATS